MKSLSTSSITHYEGKVRRDDYLGEELLIVATDRISAFDVVFREEIPDKGKVLTAISVHFFRLLEKHQIDHHLISTNLSSFPPPFRAKEFEGRSMLVRKTTPIPFECIVRGYLVGSGYKDYQKTGEVCGIPLPPGMRLAQKLPEPIFTPSTKAKEGHDQNVDFSTMAKELGEDLAQTLKQRSLEIFNIGSEYYQKKGLILADTKLEFGIASNGMLLLIDEVLTPDSSRIWEQKAYREGISPPSFDKQILRDYLETTGWNKKPPPPPLPKEVIKRIENRYKELQAWICSK